MLDESPTMVSATRPLKHRLKIEESRVNLMAAVLSLDDDELIVIRNEVKTVSLAPFSGT